MLLNNLHANNTQHFKHDPFGGGSIMLRWDAFLIFFQQREGNRFELPGTWKEQK